MPAINESIAGRLEEVASLLAQQGANRFRVKAYLHAAAALRKLDRPVSEIFAEEGLEGLEEIPGVGISIARSIRDILRHGRLAMLERMRGESDPIALLTSVPGVGKTLAWKLYGELGIASLEELELAAHDGRLGRNLGLGAKRLPVLHTSRGDRHYTALFSNTARAHQLHKDHDWVVLYWDGDQRERQCTVVTAPFGRLKGLRVVRGREMECEEYYRRKDALPREEQLTLLSTAA